MELLFVAIIIILVIVKLSRGGAASARKALGGGGMGVKDFFLIAIFIWAARLLFNILGFLWGWIVALLIFFVGLDLFFWALSQANGGDYVSCWWRLFNGIPIN